MKLVNQEVKLIDQEPGIEGIYKKIEYVGRTCYHSRDRIGLKPAKDFVTKMASNKHYSPLEHASVYLRIHGMNLLTKFFMSNRYSSVKYVCEREEDKGDISKYDFYVTTNYRVIAENLTFFEKSGIELDQYILNEPAPQNKRRVTIECITSRQVANEAIRHRTLSPMQSSTRYCNYSKGKFGSELTMINPYPDILKEGEYGTEEKPDDTLLEGVEDKIALHRISSFRKEEKEYMDDLALGAKPQESATLLPLGLATTLVLTGFIDDPKNGWDNFMSQRYFQTTGPVLPLMLDLSTKINKVFKEELDYEFKN